MELLYDFYIYKRFLLLKNSQKTIFDNNDLHKIFEYFTCIKLTQELKTQFYEYNDISPEFKEKNNMTCYDSGIDCCNLIDTIVQCKLRKNYLNWKECSTFFGSQNIFDKKLNEIIIKWKHLIIARNKDCNLSSNLIMRKNMFFDKVFDKNEMIEYCENLLLNPPIIESLAETFELRNYQIEAIKLIKNNKNSIISLPTGTGKNTVIIYSLKKNKKYLILVPRIILMEQLEIEIIKRKPKYNGEIQCIGNGETMFDSEKLITICVFNSAHIIENYCDTFEKIFIDEAHHIYKPEIYCDDEDYENFNENDEEYNEDNLCESEDVNDELKNIKSYTQIIKSLKKYENNVYLSATIDKMNNFTYYSKDIREMISLNYLCDYVIKVPIFNNDPSNKNVCNYLIDNYQNIIIYCNSCEEGKKINILMNEILNGCCDYVDCLTKKTKRNKIINNFKNGNVPFLVNVRILVEGFDAPICKGVCFLHLPKNKTTLIQIIGRCLRLHNEKTIANVILPFSIEDDDKSICNFLKTIAKNDTRIKQSFEKKQLGGYINLENFDEGIEIDANFKYEKVYNSLGECLNEEEIWMKKFEDVKKYMDDNDKRPVATDKNEYNCLLCKWINYQMYNYKYKKCIMKNELFFNTWTEFMNSDKYKKYFETNENKWLQKYEELKKYIDENNHLPKSNTNKKLWKWISHTLENYKKKDNIMKVEKIYIIWDMFIKNEKYKLFFLDNIEYWKYNLEKIKVYILKNKKRPNPKDKNLEIKKLSKWLTHQITNEKNRLQILSNDEIYDLWINFKNDENFKKFFIFDTHENIFEEKLKTIKNFILKYNKIPVITIKNKEERELGLFLNRIYQNYNKRKKLLRHDNARVLFEAFLNDIEIKHFFN
jgi:superfamily II DNA or RNA helicase